MGSRLLALARHRIRRLDRTAGLLPGAEAALDMRNRLEPHALRGLRGKRRAQAPGAEKHELLVRGEYRLVIGAWRVDPEFEHAARAMEGARHPALACQFADVADIDQHSIVAAGKLDRRFDRQRLDLAFGGFDQGLIAGGNGLRHRASRPMMVAEPPPPLKRTGPGKGGLDHPHHDGDQRHDHDRDGDHDPRRNALTPFGAQAEDIELAEFSRARPIGEAFVEWHWVAPSKRRNVTRNANATPGCANHPWPGRIAGCEALMTAR